MDLVAEPGLSSRSQLRICPLMTDEERRIKLQYLNFRKAWSKKTHTFFKKDCLLFLG